MSDARSATPTPRVSVITTARNAARYVAEAIESIQAQTFSDWEYVLVDDASEDDTAAVIERYARSDPRLVLHRRSESRGRYVAANEAIRQARGTYVALMDADDVALPHRIERHLSFLSMNPTLRACAGNVMLLIDGEPQEFRIGELPILPGALKWRLVVRWGFLPSATLIEKAAFDEIGGFRELAVSQDHRLWCDLSRRRWLGVTPEVSTYWRVHDAQLSTTRGSLQETLALDVISDHLSALSPAPWTAEEVYQLRFAGERPIPLRPGWAAVKRFEETWRADETLSSDERREVARLTRRLRSEHVRAVGRQKLESVGLGRRLLAGYRALRSAGAR